MEETGKKSNVSLRKRLAIIMCVVFALIFIIAGVLSSMLYINYSKKQTTRTLKLAIDDTQSAIELGINDYLLRLTYDVAYNDIGDSLVCVTNVNENTIKDMNGDGTFSASDVDGYFVAYTKALGYKEINIIDESGIIIYSNVPEYYGYDMASDLPGNEQAYDFYSNISKNGYYVQDRRGTSYNINNMMRYAGIRLESDCYLCKAGSYLQVGFDGDAIQEDINNRIPASAANRRVGESGLLIICLDKPVNGEYIPVGITAVGAHGENISTQFGGKDFAYDPAGYPSDTLCNGELYGIPCHFMYRHYDNYFIVSTIPIEEAHESRFEIIAAMLGLEFGTFLLLYLIVLFIMFRYVPGKVYE